MDRPKVLSRRIAIGQKVAKVFMDPEDWNAIIAYVLSLEVKVGLLQAEIKLQGEPEREAGESELNDPDELEFWGEELMDRTGPGRDDLVN